VVDSEDLPLNISRETLQHNPILDKIRDGLVKRVLSELKKRAKDDAQGYETFWNNFGPILKEGLCEAIAPKEEILEVCRFHSTQGDAMTSLDDYVARMKDGQEHIYYLTGDRLETVRESPQLEGFRKRGVEVLLFIDHVDEFWVNVVQGYKGKTFKSVTRAGGELENIGGDVEKDENHKPRATSHENLQALIAALKSIYGEQVKDVRTTRKLADSPVCLAVGEGDMDIRFEKFLRDQKQLPATAYAKILEINPDHPIITGLAARVQADASSDEVKDAAWLLLDQARILEGEELLEPAAFSRRISRFLQKGLAA
jgi:molecular chaperone HtpG